MCILRTQHSSLFRPESIFLPNGYSTLTYCHLNSRSDSFLALSTAQHHSAFSRIMEIILSTIASPPHRSIIGGGHRSGPGEHPEWQAQLRGLDTLRLAPEGGWATPASLPLTVAGLKRLRDTWIGNGPNVAVRLGEGEEGGELPDAHLVVRCARHYERAAAVVVSAAVATASLFVEPPPASWLRGEPAALSGCSRLHER